MNLPGYQFNTEFYMDIKYFTCTDYEAEVWTWRTGSCRLVGRHEFHLYASWQHPGAFKQNIYLLILYNCVFFQYDFGTMISFLSTLKSFNTDVTRNLVSIHNIAERKT